MVVFFEKIDVFRVWIPFVEPQPAWQGMLPGRDVVLLRATGPNGTCWSELAALQDPTYVSEFLEAELMVLLRYLAPRTVGVAWQDPPQYYDWLDAQVVDHGFAKAALDCLAWSMHAIDTGVGLLNALGSRPRAVKSGVVVSLDGWSASQLEWVVKSGYRRVKFKISSRPDLAQLARIREELPSDCLMVIDANGRLSPDDLSQLGFLDWVEEPFFPGDWMAYQQAVRTCPVPIVLDESIRSVMDIKLTTALRCCSGVMLKPARLGGVTPILRAASQLKAAGIQVGIGGMYETGIGRYYNLALDAAIQTELVGDASPDDRYWQRHLIPHPNLLQNGRFMLRDWVPVVDGIQLDQLGCVTVASFS